MTEGTLLLYIHGAGHQDRHSATHLKQAYDEALFERPGPSEAITWWQVFWDRPDAALTEAALDAVILRLARHPTSPEADAAELLEAIRVARPPQPEAWALDEEGIAGSDPAAALGAISLNYEAAREAAGPDEMLDWIFRLIAGQASKDVVPYLYDGWAKRMREPVKARLRELGKEQPLVVLAHSLGSIVAYDVITDPDFEEWQIQTFVTAGSPLGIKNVVDKVRDRHGPGPFPSSATAWWNFYDPRDLVGKFGETLVGKYKAIPPLTEKLDVSNERPGHHDLVGYLVDRDLQTAVKAALGV